LEFAVARSFEYEWDESLSRCIDVLLSYEPLNVNLPKTQGYTAIAMAVLQLHRTYIERMLQHPAAHRLCLDYYPGDNVSALREIITQKYPDLQPLLPAPLIESLDSSDRDIKLFAAFQRDEYNTFEENINDLPNTNPWYDEPYHSSLLEIAFQMKKREQFVEIFLESSVDPNIINSVTGMPLLHATVRSENFKDFGDITEKATCIFRSER
jgi:hypothetical protein